MRQIHSTAIVSPKAELADDVVVGPYTIIEDGVIIGKGTKIASSVLLATGAVIGENVSISHGAVIGTPPQDLKFGGEKTRAVIGNNTVVREYVTINRGTKAHGEASVGTNCFIMAYAHVAHDCIIGNNVIMANSVNLAGHVEVEDFAIIGGVVPVYNVKGVDKSGIKFSGEALAGIFLGKIKKWNDPALVALNPGTSLPDDTIVVVHRSDGSGTTFLFTNYLSKVSPDWRSRVGEGSAVKWPAGVGGKGNEGVASYVQKLNGAIGYVEYAYAKQNKLSVGQMRNRDGNFAMPSDEAFKAAAAGARWSEAPGMYLILTNQPGAKSWPLTGASFILMHKMQEDPATAKEVLKFFRWVFENGEKSASELDYVSMPDSVVKLIQFEWKKQIKDKSGKSLL